MALTVSITSSSVFGDRQARFATVTLDSSYPTGGEALSAAQLNLAQLDEVVIHSANVATKRAVWDRTNSKILVYVENGTSGIEAQAASTSDQSALSVQVFAVGK